MGGLVRGRKMTELGELGRYHEVQGQWLRMENVQKPSGCGQMNILILSDAPDLSEAVVAQICEASNDYKTLRSSWPNYDASLIGDVNLLLLCLNDSPEPETMRHLRRATKLPILLVAPTLADSEVVELYAMGVDDHLVSPVSPALLAAKLRVWERWVARLATTLYH